MWKALVTSRMRGDAENNADGLFRGVHHGRRAGHRGCRDVRVPGILEVVLVFRHLTGAERAGATGG